MDFIRSHMVVEVCSRNVLKKQIKDLICPPRYTTDGGKLRHTFISSLHKSISPPSTKTDETLLENSTMPRHRKGTSVIMHGESRYMHYPLENSRSVAKVGLTDCRDRCVSIARVCVHLSLCYNVRLALWCSPPPAQSVSSHFFQGP